MAVTDRNVSLADAGSDDLPRTLRREREARERAHQSLHPAAVPPPMPSHGSAAAHGTVPEPGWSGASAAHGTAVTAVDIPFFRLMLFCFKLVFAALPAIILLGVILWTIGHLLMTFYPWLVKVQILIRVPN